MASRVSAAVLQRDPGLGAVASMTDNASPGVLKSRERILEDRIV